MKKTFTFRVLLLVMVLGVCGRSWGQVSITTLGTAFTQNFDGMGATGTTTPSGWFVGTGTTAAGTTVIAGTGSAAGSGNYNLGVAGVNVVGERALGSLASGTGGTRNTEARFTNNTGSSITSLAISYDGEQWRLGQAASTETGVVLYYSADGTTYTAMGASYNFTPPIINGTVGAIDGNASTNRIAGIGGTYSPALAIANGSTFYIRWVDLNDAGTDAAPAVDNFSITASGGTSAVLANVTQPTGSITQGNSNVVLSGFTITPSASIDFTAVTVSGSGTATSTDITNVRIFRDNNADGIINGADAAVSAAALSYAASMAFTISGETGFSTVRNYLIVADVAGVGVSTTGRTVTASVGSGAFTTTASSNTGSATGNARTIAAPPGTSTIAAGPGTEPATISSLINTQGAASLNFDITILDDGATPATDGAASQISQMIFNQGTGNTVTNWALAIAGAELSDGTNIMTGTISSTNITFSSITNTVGSLGYIADNDSKTYTLKVWLNADMTTLKTTIDGLRLVFRIQTADVTVTGSQLAASEDQNSGAGNNAITVAASALAYVQNASNVAVNAAMAPAVTVSANDANGNRDLDFLSQVRITSTGTLTGTPVDVTAAAGLATFNTLTHTVAGAGLTLNAERTATLDWDITSATFNVTIPPAMTEVIFPQYAINGGTSASRLQYTCRLGIGNLLPSATYRYITNSSGAGNMFVINNGSGASGYITGYTSSKSLAGTLMSGNENVTAGRYGEFTTDATGYYEGWFTMVPTGNAAFNAGSLVDFRVQLNDGAGGTAVATTLTSASTITMMAPAAGANGGQAIRGVSFAGNEQMVFLYDNTSGSGRPIYGTWTEDDGIACGFTTWYGAVEGISGSWGAYIPVALSNGIRRLDFKNTSNNSLLYAVTDNDGNWNGTVNTVNPAGGTTPLVLPNSTFDDMFVSSSTTLSTPVNIKGVLTVNTGTLASGGNLTLKSDATGTARVANSAGTISGDVTVERYIPNPQRAWHLLSAQAVTGPQTIFDSWQNAGVLEANKGTLITSNLYTGSNGFDATSASGSILTHIQNNGSGVAAWNYNLANTNATALSSNQGYMVFVRGDRNCTPGNATVTPTVLSAKGTLTQGPVNVTVSSTGTGRTLVGNPYASPIDMESIFTGTANLDQNMMVWDPALAGTSGVGGYRSVVRTGVNAYTHTPFVLGTPTTPDATVRFIHSGQAFLLKATGGSANVAFTESVKATSTTTVYDPIVSTTTAADQQIITNLMVVKSDNTASLADGIRVRYNASYSASQTDDIEKMGNFGENISSYRNGKKLIVEQRPMIVSNDTIFLRMTNTAIKDYRFQIGTIDFVQADVTAYLEDMYMGSRKEIDLSGTINYIDFSVTADAASANQDRFRIVFAAKGPQPQTITTIKAARQGTAIAVVWKASNQNNMKQYEVEKSTDGISYTRVNTQSSIGINGSDATYNWMDMNPATGNNFYRIRSVAVDADFKLTQSVNVFMGKVNAGITFYPNPVTNRNIGLLFSDMEKGVYQLRLMSTTGQVVFTKTVNHTGGSATQMVVLNRGVAKGSYQLEITKPDYSKTTKAILITE